jgi:predicted lipid carrier protein YhbT
MTEAASRRFPAAVARLVSRLPQWPPSAVVAAALTALAHPGPDATLAGRVVRIVVIDAGLALTLRCREGRFEPESTVCPPDVTISADAADFVALAARRVDPDTLFFARRLAIEGDTEVGLAVRNLLDAVDVAPALAKVDAAHRTLLRALASVPLRWRAR